MFKSHSFYRYRQNIHELDTIHKNLEARLQDLQSTKSAATHVFRPIVQHSHDPDQNSVCTDQSSQCTDQSSYHSSQTDQRNQHVANSQLLHDMRSSRHEDQHNQVIHGNQGTSHTDQTNSLIHKNYQQTLNDHPLHNTSEPVTVSQRHEDTVYTLYHTGSDSEHSSSSTDYSSDDESVSSSTGSSVRIEAHPTLSTTLQPSHNIIDTYTVTHHSTSSSTLSASDDEELLVEADGPAHSEAIPLSAPVQDEQTAAMMQSVTSNLTTVTPTELSCNSDGEHSEHQSEYEHEVVVSSTESGEQEEELSTTTLVSQPLLDCNDEIKEQHTAVNSLRDITNSLSQSPPMTLKQDDHSPSHSILQQSPPKK